MHVWYVDYADGKFPLLYAAAPRESTYCRCVFFKYRRYMSDDICVKTKPDCRVGGGREEGKEGEGVYVLCEWTGCPTFCAVRIFKTGRPHLLFVAVKVEIKQVHLFLQARQL